MEKKPRIVSVGYNGMRVGQFCAALIKERVEVVVDVRYKPYSRQWQFNIHKLSEVLERYEIRYRHVEMLGNVNYKGDYDETSIIIADQASGNEVLDDLLRRHSVIAVMCVCEHHDKCHRSNVLESYRKHAGATYELKKLTRLKVEDQWTENDIFGGHHDQPTLDLGLK